MDTRISTSAGSLTGDARIATLITAALDGTLTEEQAEQLASIDDEPGTLAWLAVAKRVAELLAKTQGSPKIDPATPSGQRGLSTPSRRHPSGKAPVKGGSQRTMPSGFRWRRWFDQLSIN
jgi:hypothetical protein